MSNFRRQLRFWSLWTLTAAFALMINPWGEFKSLEMLALLGPLLLVIPRRVWREASLAIGLPLLTLAWLANPGDSSALRLLAAWAVFSVGVVLAARVLDREKELGSLLGLVAFEDHQDLTDTNHDHGATKESGRAFRAAIENELCRARRHDRRFAVLSAGVRVRALGANHGDRPSSALLRALAENRARFELLGLLRSALHLYCDVVIEGSRILALVPEVDRDTLQRLLARLETSANDGLDFDVEFGAGCFPADAVCAEELIEAADQMRKASNLISLPEQVADDTSDHEPVLRSPDVHG